MNKQEAKIVLSEQIDKLRKLTYRELLKYLKKKESNIVIKSGINYQLETQVFWDDKEQKHLRVIVSIDDGGWRAFFPLTDSFILSPDGTFIDE